MLQSTSCGRTLCHRWGVSVVSATTQENFPLADVVRGADDAVRFHLLDDAGGAIVADLQVTLDEAGGCLSLARDESHRAVVEIVAVVAGAALLEARNARGDVLVLGDRVQIRRLALLLEEGDDLL